MREWILQNTSGVLLVQIRDHNSQKARTDLDADFSTFGEGSGSTWDSLKEFVLRDLNHVWQGVSTPLNGASKARSWTMSFRNDEQVELLDELFHHGENARSRDFFRTVVFECPVEASLSWNLTNDEIDKISFGFGNDSKNNSAKEYLKEIGIEERVIQEMDDKSIEDWYRNIQSNRKRLELLKAWWKKR